MKTAAPKVRAIEPDDATLVERFLAGDQRAFDRIYHRYAKQIASTAYRLLGDDQDVDDLVQETFVIAARKLDTLQERERLRSWLITIAIRRVRRTISKRSRKRMLMRSVKHNVATSSNPSALAELEALRDVVGELSPKLRIPWVVHRVQGETLAETAQICETSVATIKRRLREADQLINKRLGRDT